VVGLLRRRWSGHRPFILLGSVALLVAAVAVYEVRTSYAQAALFARITSGFGYQLRRGLSDRIWFPEGGPHDERVGYTRIPQVLPRLDSIGFDVTHQARLSRSLARWVEWGFYPIHPTKARVGLQVYDRDGRPLVDQRYPLYTYPAFDSIPELVWRTLVYVESQGMLDAAPRRNPAVEWDRLALSAARLTLREIGAERSVPGGSTLATQIEKYRHSPGGVTASPAEKLRQMLTASLRAYSGGPETYEYRRRVVTEYLNSVPLSGRPGYGEVVGIGEGLRVWYGMPFDRANAVLASEPTGALSRLESARIYRQVLGLLVAQRRPSYYLGSLDGQKALASLTGVYLRLLEREGVISRDFAEDVRRVGPQPLRTQAHAATRTQPLPSKGVASVRAHLIGLTGARDLYELDRLDLAASGTLDVTWDSTAAALFDDLRADSVLTALGFRQQGLLSRGDPARVLYSVLLMERTELGNVVRLQTDNLPGDMRLADGSRLELGSTAKLRTLVTYLEIVAELHERLSVLPEDSLPTYAASGMDPLTRWMARLVGQQPSLSLIDALDASMQRSYSASPRERFFTGGTEQTFSNFDGQFDARTVTVLEAFRHSINLPFIRLMRDLVAYETAQLPSAGLIAAGDIGVRRQYLERFAEHEGEQFVRRFHRRYRDTSGHDVFDALLRDRQLTPMQIAWAVRSVAPAAPIEMLGGLVETYGPTSSGSPGWLEDLYRRADPTGLSASDLGYLARIHPLELWVAASRLHEPGAGIGDLLADSRGVMVEVYGWLLRTSRTDAQDRRIRSILEIEAFQRIHARWRRLGYPFEDLTPSLGTAIGSSGDRPVALAELVGMIQNGGVRLPVVRVDELRFAEGTPFETRLRLRPATPERRLAPEVAEVARRALLDVVASGTGRRAQGALTGVDETPLEIGGKTGTGDNRHRVYDARGRLVGTRVMNRTATFVFIAGDRYFGVVTAHVEGPEAEGFRFTSALPAQLLRVLGQHMGPLPLPPGLDPWLEPDLGDSSRVVAMPMRVIVPPLMEDHVHERAGDERLEGLGALPVQAP
jgi:membrane peptidoglycan carboxypeptidase